MQDEQIFLRNEVKRLRWQKDISYKFIAENVLKMNYRAFLNFIHNHSRLGNTRTNKLKEYIKSIDTN